MPVARFYLKIQNAPVYARYYFLFFLHPIYYPRITLALPRAPSQ